jgi:hypothetical protein
VSSPGRGRRRRTIGALAIGFALFGAVALRAALVSGPALNSDLRVDGPQGDWRTGNVIALYYENIYLREQAQAWLKTAGARRDPEAAREARAMLRRSLERAPANAFSWTLLAWSELALEDAEAARAALSASWRTAPYSADLSISRLMLATSLALQDDAEARPAILRDLEVGKRKNKAAYASVLESRPRLKPLADILDKDAKPTP